MLTALAATVPTTSRPSPGGLRRRPGTHSGVPAGTGQGAVRFADAVARLCAQGVRTFVALGQDATLTSMVRDCLPPGAVAIPALTREHPETSAVAMAFRQLFTRMSTVDELVLFPAANEIELPRPGPRRRAALQ